MTNIIHKKVHIKTDDNATIKYVIANKWVELALSRQEIDVSRFLRATWDLSK